MEFKNYKIKELCDIRRGASPRPIKDFISPKKEGNFPWLKIADATKTPSRFVYETKEYVTEEGASRSVLVKKGDLVLSNSATPGLPKFMGIDAYIHDGWLLLTNFKNISKEFLYYLLIFKRTELVNLSNGSVFNNLKTDIVKNFNVKIPPVYYQMKILSYLNDINEKIELNSKIIANLEELSQTLFKRWFVDFEFPDEEGKPYKSNGGEMTEENIPAKWSFQNFGNIIDISSGKRPKVKKEIKEKQFNIPIIGASKIMGYTDTFLQDSPILVIGRVGTHGVVQRFTEKCWPSDNTLVIKSKYYNFAYEYLKGIDYTSLNRGSTQPLITQKDIKNAKVILPDDFTLLEGHESRSRHILLKISALNNENEKLSVLRDTLLPKLMSGEIELPDNLEVTEDAELLQRG